MILTDGETGEVLPIFFGPSPRGRERERRRERRGDPMSGLPLFLFRGIGKDRGGVAGMVDR